MLHLVVYWECDEQFVLAMSFEESGNWFLHLDQPWLLLVSQQPVYNILDKLGKREIDIDTLAELEKRGKGTNAINLISSLIGPAYDLAKGEWIIIYKNQLSAKLCMSRSNDLPKVEHFILCGTTKVGVCCNWVIYIESSHILMVVQLEVKTPLNIMK